jgi:hypothetical protein
MKARDESFESVINCDLLQPTNPHNFASRQRWEGEVVDMVRQAGERTVGLLGLSVQEAKEDKWWGFIYDNGVVAPFGLANYLYELYSRQIWILDILPVMGDFYPRPQRQIEEFPQDALVRFREWLKVDYYSQVKKAGFRDIDLVDGRHIAQIRNVHKRRRENKENELK